MTFTIEKNWLLELWIRYPVKTFPSENYLLCMCKRIFTLKNFPEWNLPSVEMTWVLHFVIMVKLKSSSIFTSNCFYRYFHFLILNWCFKVFMGCAGWTLFQVLSGCQKASHISNFSCVSCMRKVITVKILSHLSMITNITIFNPK